MKTYRKLIDSPRLASLEAAKTAAGGQLAQTSGLFVVPALLSVDSRSLETEFIDGIERLQVVLAGMTEAEDRLRLLQRIGSVLGVIHRDLDRSGLAEFSGTDVFRPIDPVPVHGDFAGTNVRLRGPQPEIVIIDWAPPRWRPGLSALASSHWDLALFLVDLNYQRPCDPVRVIGAGELSRAFLAGYSAVRPVDRRELKKSFWLLTWQYYRVARSGLRRLARMPSSLAALSRGL